MPRIRPLSQGGPGPGLCSKQVRCPPAGQGCLTFGQCPATIPGERADFDRNPRHPHAIPAGENAEEVRAIAAALREGAVAAYPTETFYALGAAAFSKRAVERIYPPARSGTPAKALSVVASDLDMVREIAGSLASGLRSPGRGVLARAADPRPAGRAGRARIPDRARPDDRRPDPAPVLAPGPRPGDRRAPDRDERQPLRGEGTGRPAPRWRPCSAGRIDLLVDGGPAPGGLPSTIVDLCGERPRILREGRSPGNGSRRSWAAERQVPQPGFARKLPSNILKSSFLVFPSTAPPGRSGAVLMVASQTPLPAGPPRTT